MTDSEQTRIFSKNFNYYLSMSGKSQKEVADDLGFSPQTVNTWVQAIAFPRMPRVQKIADYFGIDKSDLINEHPFNEPKQTRGLTIPIYGRVAAGIPMEAIENIIDYEEIPEAMARRGEYLGLQIKGDSMEPDFHDGDYVIVRKQPDAESGDVVIALVNGNDGVCKKLKKLDDGIMLISLNPKYEPLIFKQSEIDETPVTILGKVEELRRKVI